MTAPARRKVVLLGFDACDINLVQRFARTGKLPNFHRILEGWNSAEVTNPHGFFVGALWTSFFTARNAALLGYHCWDTITQNYERRLTSPAEIVAARFWDRLGDSGRKAAVLDVPHSRAAEDSSVLEITEYGCHDRHFGLRSSRRGLLGEIDRRFGRHPVFTLDPFAERHFAADDWVHRAGMLRTPEEESLLQRGLHIGLERKQALSQWIYREGDWDLFVSIFGESHAIGHQSWYLHDPSHPRHDAALARSLGDPLEQVYSALDRALGDFLATVGEEATFFVLLSHGMQAHYDGTYILEPALTRIDSFYRSGMTGSLPGQVVKASWLKLSGRSRSTLAAPLTAVLRREKRLRAPPAYYEMDIGPAQRARQRFYMSPNNSVFGGVRINLSGREVAGLVQPGREFDDLCEGLKRDLQALINVDTGEPVVRAVERTDAHYRREPLDELPDLLIDWNHDALVETVWSPKTGMIHAPYWHWRTGDHRPDGFLLVKGAGLPTGANLGQVENRDIGPTICAMLGVELAGVEGRPIPALLNG